MTNISAFSQRSLVYFAVFGVVIATIALLLIYPDYRTLVAVDRNIQRLSARIEIHNTFFPVFQKMLTESNPELPEGVTLLKDEKLSQEKAEGIVSIFYDLSQKTGVQVMEASPDVESTLNGSGFLLLNVAVKGDFFKLQEFLLAIGSLPYLEKIEQIRLQAVEGGKEARLRLWLAKEPGGKKGGEK